MARRLRQVSAALLRAVALLIAWLRTHHPWYWEPIDAETAAALRRTERCAHCGGYHLRSCPRVKRIVFKQSSEMPQEVEYWPWGHWPTRHIVWPEDLEESQ